MFAKFTLMLLATAAFSSPLAFASDEGDLNPQPLPPIAEEMAVQLADDEGDLNPQPLPPIVEDEFTA